MKIFYNYFSVLSFYYKKKFIFLLFLLFLNTFLEIASLSSVVPVLQSLTQESSLDIYTTNFFFNFFDYEISKIELIQLYVLLFILVFLLKTLFAMFYIKKKWTYIAHLKADYSYLMLNDYFYKRIEKVFKIGSVNMIRLLDTELDNFCGIVSDSMLSALNSIFIIIGLSVIVFILQPYVFLTNILIFSFFILLFNLLIKNKIKYYGEIRFNSQKKKIKLIQNFFLSIREIKIFNRIDYFLKIFLKELNLLKISEKKYYTLLQNLKPIIEFAGVLFFFSFFLISIFVNKNDTSTVFVGVGVLLAASFRIIPALHNLFSSASLLKFHLPVVDLIKKEIDNIEKIKSHNGDRKINCRNIDFTNSIIIRDLFFKYTGSTINVLENINISIEKGDVVYLGGSTGSGKTTLINIIAGFLKPSSGKILIDSANVYPESNCEYILNAAYVSQDVVLLEDSVKNNVIFGITNEEINEEKVINALKSAEVYDLMIEQKLGIDSSITELGMNFSGGEKQRIAIARAYYNDAEIFILDEPTSALDKKTQDKIIQNLINKNKTIILIAHDFEMKKYCNKVYEIKNKKLIRTNI